MNFKGKTPKDIVSHNVDACRQIYKLYKLKFNSEPNTIFDLGANEGIFSLGFSECNPSASIYSFEPVKDTFDILINNLSTNNSNNVKAFNYGVSDKSGEFKLGMPTVRKHSRSGIYSLFHSSGNVVTCEIRNFNSVLNELEITGSDIIKIDIEGSEFDVLNNAQEFFKNSKLLSIELHPDFDCDRVTKLLYSLGYKFLQDSRGFDKIFINKAFLK